MQVIWYFDFISPFAYLQSERLDQLPEFAEIEYKPVLFAGLLNHWGHKGPAEIESKRTFTYRQVLWISRRDGIPLRAPPVHPFNPLGVLRLAIALGSDQRTVQTIFRFIWKEGQQPDDADSWSALLDRLNSAEAANRISTTEVKAKLRSNTEEAIAQGVFGVPTIGVRDEIFWGYDTTDMATAYINDPSTFEDSEMRRIRNLPIGIQRKRK